MLSGDTENMSVSRMEVMQPPVVVPPCLKYGSSVAQFTGSGVVLAGSGVLCWYHKPRRTDPR